MAYDTSSKVRVRPADKRTTQLLRRYQVQSDSTGVTPSWGMQFAFLADSPARFRFIKAAGVPALRGVYDSCQHTIVKQMRCDDCRH